MITYQTDSATGAMECVTLLRHAPAHLFDTRDVICDEAGIETCQVVRPTKPGSDPGKDSFHGFAPIPLHPLKPVEELSRRPFDCTRHNLDDDMNRDGRIVRCEEMLEADLNGEIVALHIERGQCYGLNAVAADIWRMLAEPISIDEICTRLTEEYEIDSPTCREEVLRLVSQLEDEGLVKHVAS